ncbi:MAG: DUF2281 domain-containing protein [Oscillospiraceae bacterium]|nr:DUF2281 domain-containing protein [Oscillospiraceae bacterium]
MTEIVLNTNTLPEPLLRMIHTEKVTAREADGIISLIPVGMPKKRPRSEMRGILKGKVWMADDFDAPLEEMKEYME